MPTVVNKTIQASGGDYADPALWEADTDNDLVTADEQHNGNMASETFTFTGSTSVLIEGAVTDSTRFRVLTVQSGADYESHDDTGAVILYSGSGASVAPVQVHEDYGHIEGFGINADHGHGGRGACYVNQDSGGENNMSAARITVNDNMSVSGGANAIGFHLAFGSTSVGYLRNCLYFRTATSTNGCQDGFTVDNSNNHFDSNCAYNARIYGMNVGAVNCENAISMSSGTADYVGSVGNADYCVASDASPTGTAPVTNQDPVDVWEDAANDDFRLGSGSPAIDAGNDFSRFSDDLDNNTRSGTWDCGCYDETAGDSVATLPPRHATVSRAAPRPRANRGLRY